MKPLFWASSCVIFFVRKLPNKFPCLTEVHFVPAKRCEHAAMPSSPRSEQSAWSHIIISMGGAQLTFWRRQRPYAIPETFHPKFEGLLYHTYTLDMTKDGGLPSFKPPAGDGKKACKKGHIENPVFFRGYINWVAALHITNVHMSTLLVSNFHVK